MTMKITDSEEEIDIKSKKVEWGGLIQVSRYYYHERQET